MEYPWISTNRKPQSSMHIPAYPRWTCHVFLCAGWACGHCESLKNARFGVCLKSGEKMEYKARFQDYVLLILLRDPVPCRFVDPWSILSPVQDWWIFMCLRRYLERNAKVRWMLTPMSAAFNPQTKTSVILVGRPYHPLSGRFLDFCSQNFYCCIKAMADGTNKACGYWR